MVVSLVFMGAAILVIAIGMYKIIGMIDILKDWIAEVADAVAELEERNKEESDE